VRGSNAAVENPTLSRLFASPSGHAKHESIKVPLSGAVAISSASGPLTRKNNDLAWKWAKSLFFLPLPSGEGSFAARAGLPPTGRQQLTRLQPFCCTATQGKAQKMQPPDPSTWKFRPSNPWSSGSRSRKIPDLLRRQRGALVPRLSPQRYDNQGAWSSIGACCRSDSPASRDLRFGTVLMCLGRIVRRLAFNANA
jgi:hypothetical protein